MRTVVHPRGRLPARVYWFRRSLVLLTALALVFAIGRLLSGSGPTPTTDRATVTASSPTPTPSPTRGVAGPMPLQPAATTGKAAGPSGAPVVLAAPSGPCALDEITVAPTVPTAAAGKPVDLVLELTGIKPACTLSVSNRTLVAKVTSGNDRIWSTQDCPKAIRPASVVVRSAEPTKVVVSWSGRRSDDRCSRSTGWALPGYYHVTAAVIGSEPNDTQFRLGVPPRPVVTRTAKPHVTKTKKKKQGSGTVCGGDNAAGSC